MGFGVPAQPPPMPTKSCVSVRSSSGTWLSVVPHSKALLVDLV